MNGSPMKAVRQYSSFFVDRFHFAIDVDHVQEVVRPMPTTPVPLTSEVIDGLVNLRGQIVTAVDLRSRLELPRRADAEPAVSLVVRTGSGLICLRVDRLGDVIDVDDSTAIAQISSPPLGDSGKDSPGRTLVLETLPDTVTSAVRDIALGVIQLEETLLLVLNPDLLLTSAVSQQPEEAER